jgi:hypothetical protein
VFAARSLRSSEPILHGALASSGPPHDCLYCSMTIPELGP